MAWDRSTGKPLSPAILWMDNRTDRLIAKLPYSRDHFKPICGLPISTYFTGLKARWLLEQDSDGQIQRHAQDGTLALGTVDSWLLHVRLLLKTCIQIYNCIVADWQICHRYYECIPNDAAKPAQFRVGSNFTEAVQSPKILASHHQAIVK